MNTPLQNLLILHRWLWSHLYTPPNDVVDFKWIIFISFTIFTYDFAHSYVNRCINVSSICHNFPFRNQQCLVACSSPPKHLSLMRYWTFLLLLLWNVNRNNHWESGASAKIWTVLEIYKSWIWTKFSRVLSQWRTLQLVDLMFIRSGYCGDTAIIVPCYFSCHAFTRN